MLLSNWTPGVFTALDEGAPALLESYDGSQLATMARQAKSVLAADALDVDSDRGYYNGNEIRACEQAGIDAYLPREGSQSLQVLFRWNALSILHLSL